MLLLGHYRHSQTLNLSSLTKQYPGLRLTFMTVHRSKGLEADYGVVAAHSEAGIEAVRSKDARSAGAGWIASSRAICNPRGEIHRNGREPGSAGAALIRRTLIQCGAYTVPEWSRCG